MGGTPGTIARSRLDHGVEVADHDIRDDSGNPGRDDRERGARCQRRSEGRSKAPLRDWVLVLRPDVPGHHKDPVTRRHVRWNIGAQYGVDNGPVGYMEEQLQHADGERVLVDTRAKRRRLLSATATVRAASIVDMVGKFKIE